MAKHDRALSLAEHPGAGPVAGEEREQRVERPDRAGEQRSAASRELALDAIDVDAIRDDQPRIAVEGGDEPVEQKRDLAGMCRADDERETHQPIVVGPLRRLPYAGTHRRKVRQERAARRSGWSLPWPEA